jgi:hypothetical protein
MPTLSFLGVASGYCDDYLPDNQHCHLLPTAMAIFGFTPRHSLLTSRFDLDHHLQVCLCDVDD